MLNRRRLIPAACIAAFAAQCAIVIAQQKKSDSTEGLEKTVLQYWAHRQDKNLPAAYPFYCESFRSRVSLNEFTKLTRLNRFDLTDLKVVDIASNGTDFSVTISYHYMAPMISDKQLDGKTAEAWKRDPGGKWCKADEPTALPFPRGR